jgi:hypothetical protein
MDVISSDRKTVGKLDHLEGADRIKLTKQSSPDGQHHHLVPASSIAASINTCISTSQVQI